MSIDPSTKTITLDRPLDNDHAAGEGAGVEWIRYRWYADALLDNIFWHDHVDGIHGWGHGGVGMLIIEPKGSDLPRPDNRRRGRLGHGRRHPLASRDRRLRPPAGRGSGQRQLP